MSYRLNRLTHPLPSRVMVGVSGGKDSVGALFWLRNRVARIIHIHHGRSTDSFRDQAEAATRKAAEVLGVPCDVYRVQTEPSSGESLEGFWRSERYKFFEESCRRFRLPLITAHHIRDSIESYLMGVLLQARFGSIPFSYKGMVLRPFRAFQPEVLHRAIPEGVETVEDPHNFCLESLRARVRHSILPFLSQELNTSLYRPALRALRAQDEFDGQKNRAGGDREPAQRASA